MESDKKLGELRVTLVKEFGRLPLDLIDALNNIKGWIENENKRKSSV